jgi:putative DNA methylase
MTVENARYPKRLIEVDLPIKEISAHARREKSIRHGHISTLHIWWARRPLAACRAVLCASLWPDPADPLCPQSFREEAAKVLCEFAEKVRTDKQVATLCQKHWERWLHTDEDKYADLTTDALLDMRGALLDFIADFASWDASSVAAFLACARGLTCASSIVSTSQKSGDFPGVIDPFAGGGSIPLEALRVGASAHASDLNPIAVMLNRATLDLIPRYGPRLAEAVRTWGDRIRKEAAVELEHLYPHEDSGVPIAYVWARTIRCEGPGCGVELPLMQSPWLARKPNRSVGMKFKPAAVGEAAAVEIVTIDRRTPANTVSAPTIKRGAATCPFCGFTTTNDRIRAQLFERRGGSRDARMLAVIEERPGAPGRFYREPTAQDINAARKAAEELDHCEKKWTGVLSLVPNEHLPRLKVWKNNPIRVHLYGMQTWGDLFTARQALTLTVLRSKLLDIDRRLQAESDKRFSCAVTVALALALGRQVDRMSTLCFWHSIRETLEHTFSRQALSLVPMFPESNPFCDSTGSFANSVEWVAAVAQAGQPFPASAVVTQSSATNLPLPDDSAQVLFTDPPYYDAVPYGELSDFFYVWMRRAIGHVEPELFADVLVDKRMECVFNPEAEAPGGGRKDGAFFRKTMEEALADARRVVVPDGIGVVVFAHKSTSGWEAQLQAMLNAGWIITASWPLDTEMNTRLRAQGSAALASSIHLVCRPRENSDGSLRVDDVGSWRSVLAELPARMHTWMPRLADEGVVGADAIFACLGPALEIFSQYSRVEKSSGEVVSLAEYLEAVWAAVAREALSLMFDGADASGLEEDARLTAMWLWTLGAGATDQTGDGPEDDGASATDDGEQDTGKLTGFVLEYDAARKIAQGLGAHLDKLTDVVELKGDKARLLAVSERAKHLFGKENLAPDAPKQKKAKTSKKQLGLFAEIEAAEKQGLLGAGGVPKVGETTLDKVHQSMILFGAGRSEALKRFIVEEGVGKDGRFWKLAQSLSALYPSGSEEKRWVDGVLARKKSLGFG